MVLFFLGLFFSLLLVLVRVAFFTLLERKGLAYSQTRSGPNKLGLGGVVQPVLDALKLLTKKSVAPHQISPGFFL